MKKTNYSKVNLCFALSFLFSVGNIYSQSSTLSHFVVGFPTVNWCGWDALTPIPLNIEHRGNQRINFSTNGFNRMFIDGGSNNVNNGRIAIGNNLPVGFIPQARFHLHHTGSGTPNIRFTSTITGSSATNGLEIGINTIGDAVFTNYQINRSFFWNNGGAVPLTRMRLYDGGPGQNMGRLAISDSLPATFVPADRFVAYESIATGSVQIRFQNSSTNASATDGYAVGVSNTNLAVNHTQFERRQMRWLLPNSRLTGNPVTEWMRIENNPSVPSVLNALNTTDGYMGLNNPAPDFHIDAITPAIAGQELFNSFRTSDASNSRMGMINGTVANSFMAPTFYGSLVEPTQTAYALQTLASITNATDSGSNPIAVTWFRAGKNWAPNSGNPFDALDPIENRYAFAWVNGTTIKMHMNAKGQLRIGTALSVVGAPSRNRLEVSANAVTDPHGADIVTNGTSGVRLTYLTALKTPYAVNPGTGVLGVDTAGNIIYVPASAAAAADNGLSTNGPTAGAIHLGQDMAAGGDPGKLLNNRQVPMYGKNIYFTGQDTITKSAVYIGYTGNAADQGKLNVKTTTTNLNKTTAAIKGINRSFYNASGAINKEAIGVLGISDTLQAQTRLNNIGVKGVAEKWEPIGVHGLANDNQVMSTSIGVLGEATSAIGANIAGKFNATTGIMNNIGVKSEARDAAICQGVVGTAIGFDHSIGGSFSASSGSIDNIGVYATAPNAPNDFAGYFQGNVFISGIPYASQTNFTLSDKNIKTNVTTINSSMAIINKLRPVSFKCDNHYVPQLNVDNNLTYGFIAQEVGVIVPDLIKNVNIPETRDSVGNITNPRKTLSSLNYSGLIPFAIGGIQELDVKQKEMQTNIDNINLSDAQVKTNVNTFNALATIKTLNPVKYNFTNTNVPQLTFKPNTDYGFVAQQLESVYPELVDTIRVAATYDSVGVVINPSKVLKTVNYKAMSALLVRSIQEQQVKIDSLTTKLNSKDSIQDARLTALENAIASCCSNANSRTSNNQTPTTNNSLDIELSDKDAIVLNQNVPNPFAEQTTITYNVPATVGKAQLIFFNTNGQVIQTVDIKTRGKGKVNVFASDLSSGLYNYSLVADGKVIDSKKMVRE